MTPERRNALKQALTLALLTATPASIFAASRRRRDPSARFLWIELKGRRFLSLDTVDQDRAYLLSTKPLADGKYRLRDGRSFVVRAGRIVPSGEAG